MKPFTVLTGRVLPLDRAHVDTDQIIPKQFLLTTGRAGLGRGLFYAWRQDPGFVLNQPQYQGASILVAGENFGCGSSREHAPWALLDYGIRCVIAPSFGDIFYNNCCQNGLLPVRVAEPTLRPLFQAEELTVDLPGQQVRGAGAAIGFEMDPFRKQCLVEGLDDIALTLRHEAEILAYEVRP
ncbi:MAG TPA: 3-isopropylmalate dehydratase small subunit [Terriglobales bacterium]|nr:3-isopropylmalate dehydratase small subunit [Terriglobales bacterium]